MRRALSALAFALALSGCELMLDPDELPRPGSQASNTIQGARTGAGTLPVAASEQFRMEEGGISPTVSIQGTTYRIEDSAVGR